MIRVEIPGHLRTLARLDGEVELDLQSPVTQGRILDALEEKYPMLRGTIRDQTTRKRRAFVRYFACEQDFSDEPADAPLPDAIANGVEPFLVVGAIAGGSGAVTNTSAASGSKRKLWAGYILSGLVILFLLMDAGMKLAKAAVVVQTTVQLGYPESCILPLGITLLICTLLYAIPRTSVLGAILLTGYLGGAVATHVRVGNPLFSNVLFPVYLGIFLWAGLALRDRRVSRLLL